LSPKKIITENVGKIYAGRASSSPIVDLFITLLSMGLNGYTRLLKERQDVLETFPTRLQEVAQKHGERLLSCPSNTISFGVTLDSLARPKADEEEETAYFKDIGKGISSFGAMLFIRCVSGTRVVPRGEIKTLGGQEFVGFGSSVANYNHAYVTAACAIGVNKAEVDEFFIRFDKTLTEFKKKQVKKK
jgi:O-phospho-L-seryl-tRNASec:L-selenocysteinyl-tRNA synthase